MQVTLGTARAAPSAASAASAVDMLTAVHPLHATAVATAVDRIFLLMSFPFPRQAAAAQSHPRHAGRRSETVANGDSPGGPR
ncbi:hypothetical protein DEJ50_31720 [Streptomyces venezuelae]|uniref:Uncharacterized protein n=2 Tax=Streptomyces venezuelae TaxID=54571 RepID=A0A5P2DAG9_STRVZ|nr:hypothetical protein DEJ50_31720 [Streptomyces venezuelae]